MNFKATRHLKVFYPRLTLEVRAAGVLFSSVLGRLHTAPLSALRGHDNNPQLDNNLSYHIGS